MDAVAAAGVVDEPGLVGIAAFEVWEDEWEHIVVGLDDGVVEAVFQ